MLILAREFPYKLRLMNINTKDCMVCNKPIKSPHEVSGEKYVQSKAETEEVCHGNCVNEFSDRPYIFDIKCATNLIICLDWIDENSFDRRSLETTLDKS